jgi:hypothetical protein
MYIQFTGWSPPPHVMHGSETWRFWFNFLHLSVPAPKVDGNVVVDVGV